MNNFLNFENNIDVFEEQLEEESKVFIKTQQRTGRKYWTLIYGLTKNQRNNTFIKHLKKHFSCAVSIKKDKEDRDIILMQGLYNKDLVPFLKEHYDIDIRN